MKAMVPLAMDELHHHNSSSTESAQDHPECDHRIDTPKKRPSKIPLLGQKGYLAPKPPTGRNSTTPKISQSSGGGLSSTSSSSAIGISGPSSTRSLSKSTGSLIGRSGPPSSVKRDTSTILNRPESAQSIRKDSSLGNCSRGSSIPISAKISPPRTNNSPVPKTKRDTLSSRVRNMDSLSRINQSTTITTTGNMVSSSSTTNLYKTNSKKDLSSNFSTGSNRNSKQITQSPNVSSPSGRRVSNTSTNSRIVDLSSSTATEPENGKVQTLRTRLWNMLKI